MWSKMTAQSFPVIEFLSHSFAFKKIHFPFPSSYCSGVCILLLLFLIQYPYPHNSIPAFVVLFVRDAVLFVFMSIYVRMPLPYSLLEKFLYMHTSWVFYESGI